MKKWRITIDGTALRKALDEQDIETMLEELNKICKELVNNYLITNEARCDFQDFIDEELAFHDKDDDEDVLDLMLSDFWDRCDHNGVWISIGLKTDKGMV